MNETMRRMGEAQEQEAKQRAAEASATKARVLGAGYGMNVGQANGADLTPSTVRDLRRRRSEICQRLERLNLQHRNISELLELWEDC